MLLIANRHLCITILLIINIVFANGVTNDRVITYVDNPNHKVLGGLGFTRVEVFAPLSDAVESELCKSDSIRLINGVRNKELWALKMLDATTKDPDGVLVGSLSQMGNYDECLSVQGVQGVPGEVGTFSGRHCLVSLGPRSLFSQIEQRAKSEEEYMYRVMERLNGAQGDVTTVVSVLGATIGVCIPSSCTSRDLERHLRTEMRSTNISVRVDDLACSSSVDKTEFQPSDWCAVALLVCFGTIIMCSTYIDIVNTACGPRHDLVTAFSLCTNMRKLLKVAPPSANNIPALNGFRVVNMLWVIFIHRMLLEMVTPHSAYTLAYFGFDDVLHLPATTGTLCIETFLLLSGLLVCYNFLKEREKGVRFNLIRYYLHRYIRLTPPYAVMMFLTATLFNYLGDGPLWKTNMAASREGCEKYWMFGLLYVNNYYPNEEMCMGRLGESWYLAADMQLFLLSPIILFPVWRWARVGKVLVGTAIFAGLLTACTVPFVHRYPFSAMPGNNPSAFNQYYTTHTRFTPWLLGICLGYVLHMTKKKTLKLSRTIVVGGWILGMLVTTCSIMLAYFFLQKDHVYNRLADSLYTGLSRPGLALGVAWMVFACVKGYGGKFNAFFSCAAMQVLGRLIYSVYLTHLTVLRHFYSSVRTPQYGTKTTLARDYISSVVICFLVALVLHLAVEAPILNIERILTKQKTPVEEKEHKGNGVAEIYIPRED